MFSSSDNVDELTPTKDETISDKLLIFGDTDCSREKLGESAYFFDFPSPHFDYVDMDILFLQEHQDYFPYQEQLSFGMGENVFEFQGDSGCREEGITINGGEFQDGTKTSKSTSNETPTGKNAERKKSSNRERHSKINTAQGTRDRRMRLSVEIARKFFALQDMLCFDKASKTIEWLLIQAKDEIDKVSRQSMHLNNGAIAKSASSTTDQYELVSVNDEGNVNGNSTKNKGRQRRKFASKPIGRESREKARERARERTKMKMQNQRLQAMEINEGNMRLDLSNCSSIEAGNEEVDAQSLCMNPSFEEILADVEGPGSTAGDKINQKWSPSSAFCYL